MGRRPTQAMVKVLRTARNGGTDANHRAFDVALCIARDWIETQPSIHKDAQSLTLTEEGERALEHWDSRFTELRD